MMAKKFWDSEKSVGEVEKEEVRRIRFYVEKYGRKYVAVSEWKFDEKAGVEKPIGTRYPVEAIDDVCDVGPVSLSSVPA